MKYLLAIDEGTSSTRAMIYDTSGKLLCMSQQPLTQHFPQPGWVEQDPEEIWSKTLAVMAEVMAQIDKSKIVACGITNQRETTLVWDKATGKCLYPAIVWQDRRTEDYCHSLADLADSIRNKTGLLPDAYFSASKLHWLLENIPEARRLAAKNQLAFGTIDSFLLWRLTRGRIHATDVTNASRTMLFNIHQRCWDEELLAVFDLPRSIFPAVFASNACVGHIDSALFGTAIPVTGMVGDQQAALIGQRCFEAGMVKATFGTGGFLLMNTGVQAVLSTNKLLTTIAWQLEGQPVVYGLEGSLYHAGSTVKWLRDEMRMITSAAETESLAISLPGNEGVYLVPSFTGIGAPHWLSTSGALIVGLSLQSNRAHFARAALESVCYQTREVLGCMQQDSELPVTALRVDGGMTINHWFLQFLATQCGVLVQKPRDIESTGQGAAMLAASGCDEALSFADMQSSWVADCELLPGTDADRREQDFKGWLQALNMLKKM